MSVKLKVKNVFKCDINDREKFVEAFNYRLLKIIIYLETKGEQN